jgi:PAS domain S-box-containing protein
MSHPGPTPCSEAQDPATPGALDIARYRDPILDSINEGVFTVGLDWRITSFNRAAESITGIRREDAIGHRCSEVLRANICADACALRTALDTGQPNVNASVFVVDAWGERIPIKVSAAVLRGNDGRVIGGVETFQDLRQVEELRKELSGQRSFADIVGKSPAMTRLFAILPHVADSAATVLVHGESGTGKELVARAIHALSPRRRKRFVAVSCGALPDALLESELFGYKAGPSRMPGGTSRGGSPSPTGGRSSSTKSARFRRPCRCGSCVSSRRRCTSRWVRWNPCGRTCGSSPPPTRIWAVGARGQVPRGPLLPNPRGSDRRPRPARAARGHPLLVDHFVATYNRRYDQQITGLSREAMSLLVHHDFPGNVRELQNILEHAFVLCRGGPIELRHLPPDLTRTDGRPQLAGGRDMNLRSVGRLMIQEALARHRGNRRLAARELGINPSTLYRQIRRLGIEVPDTDGRGKRS